MINNFEVIKLNNNNSLNSIDLEKDIKSLFIKRKIFSYLDEKKKLNILKYNKIFQKKFAINIGNYINKSGIYKINGINGQGKEYLINTNILIFEGEYLNKKKNGKGKEYYDNGCLKFEGKYKNGKRNGKGKEYDINEELIFKGEYLNGLKWNGKGYNTIETEIINGNGYITIFHKLKPKILKFEGKLINGEINGEGKEYNIYGKLIFKGEYLNGLKWNGKGYNNIETEIINGNGKIKEYYQLNPKILKLEGEYIKGKLNGEFKEYYDNGKLKYEGKYLNNQKNGMGKEYYDNNKLKYIGNYLNGIKNGKGKEFNKKGIIIYKGEYLNGKRSGKGKEYDRFTKLKFEGNYLKGQRLKGKEFDKYGNLIYEGNFLNDKKHGEGKEYNNGELIFEGEYYDGKVWNGKGKRVKESFQDNSKIIFDGEFQKGRLWNGIRKDYNSKGELVSKYEYSEGERLFK